ncbi:F-box/kelch-repeat protein At1g55270 isoform X3 [Cryptomeria japonica]|uniref:F-box/kelch-repeat protein At1g55270 isoform X3 n=1 Tax=Cryptomeria japonica TaxID=3369 RepID=UPI0025AC9E0B|nr:F-box/kelch-repeat protein At1g55270 isoform X3 [Cryptomeria japonica]
MAMAMEIIPGLPDEIGRQCLLRVPLTSHYKLARVCKTWKHIVHNPLFYQDRNRLLLPCFLGQQIVRHRPSSRQLHKCTCHLQFFLWKMEAWP